MPYRNRDLRSRFLRRPAHGVPRVKFALTPATDKENAGATGYNGESTEAQCRAMARHVYKEVGKSCPRLTLTLLPAAP